MITQLRVFTINRGKMDEFVAGWKGGVYPLRLKQGYTIPAAWVVRQTNQFVWLLSYDGPQAWEAKEKAYYQSAERAAVNPDPAQLIARAEHYMLQPVIPLEGGTD